MHWNDRVYGEVSVDDPQILALIACPTFQRLKGIKQSGPSAFAFPFKTVTRFEHCVGAYVLLNRLGADLREQVAGLLHDISHTAFSHAVDFVYSSDEQNHHEQLKHTFLERPDIVSALRALRFAPADFFDDTIYPLLERPLPWLCADRFDYFCRDGLACNVLTTADAARFVANLAVVDRTLVFTDVATAQLAVERFAAMNRGWWASPTESYIYNEFADALREGLRVGALLREDLLNDDAHVLACLEGARSPLIDQKLHRIFQFDAKCLAGYEGKVTPKVRWIDPPVRVGQGFAPLSQLTR